VVTIKSYHCHELHEQFYTADFCLCKFHAHVKSLGIVSVESGVISEIQVLHILHTSDVSEETGINGGSVSAIYRPQEGRMFKLEIVC